MSSAVGTMDMAWRRSGTPITVLTVGAAFLVLFWPALLTLVQDWVTSGEYGHGFLLVPLSGWLAYNRRVEAEPRPRAGLIALAVAVGVFLLGTLAGERFTQRIGAVGALVALTVYYRGTDQLRAWWLPFALIASSIPLPEVVLDTVTLPLQLLASDAAVWLLQARHIPAGQAGNVIFLPGHELFVAAACSGLRSISALLGLTLLIGGTCVRSPLARVLLIALAVPAAIGANVLRVFATGFAAFYFGPSVATGLSHHAMAAVAFALPLGLVGLAAWVFAKVDL